MRRRITKAVPTGAIGGLLPRVGIRGDGKLPSFRDFEDMNMHISDSSEDLLVYELAIDRKLPLLITEKQ